MTTYSVWNYDTRAYDYYQGPGSGGTHAGSPPVRASSSLGATPEQAAWPLPMGAKKIGSGKLPKGRIAVKVGPGVMAFAGIDLSDPVSAVAVAILAVIIWKNRKHLL